MESFLGYLVDLRIISSSFEPKYATYECYDPPAMVF